MRATKLYTALAVVCLSALCLTATNSYGQTGGPEAGETPINVTLEEEGELAIWARNVEDPLRKKLLTFNGTLTSDGPSIAMLSFDWRDASGAVQVSTPVSVDVSPNGTSVMIEHEVDFCPRRVSFHALAGAAPLMVDGLFRHECLIPEPGTGLLATAGLGALTLLRRKQLA